jgi:hypothetical protein
MLLERDTVLCNLRRLPSMGMIVLVCGDVLLRGVSWLSVTLAGRANYSAAGPWS